MCDFSFNSSKMFTLRMLMNNKKPNHMLSIDIFYILAIILAVDLEKFV